MSSSSSKSSKPTVTGEEVATLDRGYVLVRVGPREANRPASRPGDTAEVLLKKAGAALNKPGIPKRVVFGPALAKPGRIYAYSADPADPSRIVREASDGTRTVGRLVGGNFRPLPVKAPA